MKKLLLNTAILDLNGNEMRYIGTDNEIHAHTFASRLHAALQRTSVPVPKIDLYKSVLAKVEAALSAVTDTATELTDDEFAVLDGKAAKTFGKVELWRWKRLSTKKTD